MKKLLALALALMLLMASAAFAETANTTTFSNIHIVTTTPAGTQEIDLSDLTATLAVGSPDGVPSIQLDVTGGGEALLGAEIQFIGGNMVLNIDGLSRPIAASMNNAQAQEAIEGIFANLDSATNAKLPAFTGVDIPKLPLMSVLDMLPMLGIEPVNDGQTATFEIPAELISSILQMVLSQVPAETKAQLGGLDQLLANVQMAVVGKVSDDGNTAELLLDLVPVQDGLQSDVPFAGLYLVSSNNSDSLEILLYQDGSPVTLGKLDLTSDPAAATLDFALDLMGQVKLGFSLYPQDGAQVAAIALEGNGETMNASLTYGEEGDQEYALFAFEIPNQNTAASIDITEHPAADGSKEGAVDVKVTARDQTVNLTADLAEGKGDVAFRAIANASQAYDASRMTEADNQALGQELQNALGGLMNYLNNVIAQPAA